MSKKATNKNYKLNFSSFISQLDKHEKLCDENSLIESIRNYELQFPDESTYIPKSGFDKVISSLLQPRIEMLINELYYATEKCESPIEVLMLYGLLIIGREYHDTVNVKIDNTALFKIGDSPYELMIEPQKKIGKYRVDFLISSTEYNPRIKLDGYHTKQLVVECDGKEYHTKPDQIARDKKRDSELLQIGYKVYRYTGSNIWKELMNSIEEIFRLLKIKDIS